MKLRGKLIGFILGIVVINNIFASIILFFLGHFLFDSKDDVEAVGEELTVNNEIPPENVLFLKTILELCSKLMNLKGNIVFNEIVVINDFFVNYMKFDKRDLEYVDVILKNYNLVNSNKKGKIDSYERPVNLINQFCRYDEKVNIIHLLFALAVADNNITKEEYDFIFDVSQKLEIRTSDFNNMKNHFVVEEIDPYKILNVPHDATVMEVKKAYRRLMVEHHPDKFNKNYDKEKFQKIVNSYKTIMKIKKS